MPYAAPWLRVACGTAAASSLSLLLLLSYTSGLLGTFNISRNSWLCCSTSSEALQTELPCHIVRKMSTSIYLELPWKGKGPMIGDIVGFVAVTILLIAIDSYILCEQQNTLRIVFSIGIDYFILFVYMAIRNIALASGYTTHSYSNHQKSTYAAAPQDYSKTASNYSPHTYSIHHSSTYPTSRR